MKKLMKSVIFGVCVLGTVANAFTGVLQLEKEKTWAEDLGFHNLKFKDTNYYVNFERASGSNGDETVFGKQPVDVIVGKLGAQTNFLSFGLEKDDSELGVTIMTSSSNNNQYGVGGDFKFVSSKGFAGFKPYFGGKVLIACQDRADDTVMLSYNENMVSSIVGTNPKKGRYKATINDDIITFLIKSGLGIKKDIGENITLFASYDLTFAKHAISYRVEGESVEVDTSVSQSSSGVMFGIGVKF